MFSDSYFNKFVLPDDLREALVKCQSIAYLENQEELDELVFGPTHTSQYDVVYTIAGRGRVKEAEVIRCKNGALVNFMEDYMRRRDPNSMVISDGRPTDKPRFADRFGYEFSSLRRETMDWFTTQRVIMLPFKAGDSTHGYDSLMICPANAAFFALALANMQGFVSINDIPDYYTPRAIIYVAPPFRHTHFDGKQVVVHNRSQDLHEVFAYNLYPGPSAKKGVYSVLLDIGEQEDWICCHASAALVETPYENEIVFMHEGASGGGKSEMLEDFKREDDSRLLLGTHITTGERYYLDLRESSTIYPISDDMALAHKGYQDPEAGKLMIVDAEAGWFLRMDSLHAYGNNPVYEKASIHPTRPLLFFNMDGVPGATCLIWEHVTDSNGQPCPNPRVIIPRDMIENITPREPQEVSVRSFGVRMPPSTAAEPNYGIMGMLHIIPPALAWLWRLVAPRGFKNPQHRGRRQPDDQRGRGLLLALRHRQEGDPGQPAAAADHGLPQHPQRAHPQPAHRRLQRGLHERVGQPGVPVPPQRGGEGQAPHPRPVPPVRLRPAGHEAGRPVHPPHLPAARDPVEAGGARLRRGGENSHRLLQGGDCPVRNRRAGPPGPGHHPLLPQ